ncbi:hypothetical protein F4803DRAFT_107224 [Xylaria telfairii]|nr:hypothetical protein F4803DRAFT_107224 [Xylaria telfairii]
MASNANDKVRGQNTGQIGQSAVEPDYIDAVTVIKGDSDVKPPQGYTKVGVDLNAGAGGDYIYLCYHKVHPESNKQAVVGLQVIWDHESTPQGYERIEEDLNAGAGGKYIYLCYKTDYYAPQTAILDVVSYSTDDPDLAAPYGYIKIDRDLNAGAGGKYVFIAYKTADSAK